MTTSKADFSRALRTFFRLYTASADGIDLWPRIQQELARPGGQHATPKRRPRRRALLLALALVALLTTVAASGVVLVSLSSGPAARSR